MGGFAPTEKDLLAFRRSFHGCMRRRTDALFELADAILSAGPTPSPPHLSLAPVHRRGWVSLYAALTKGRIDDGEVRELLARHSLAKGGPPLYAVDVSPWPRCDAETSPGRCYLYLPSRHSARRVADRDEGPAEFRLAAAHIGNAGTCAETPREIARQAEGQHLGACQTVPGREEGRLKRGSDNCDARAKPVHGFRRLSDSKNRS
jgi:hypothetical protein